jgi:hypothetical protein
MPSKPKIGPQIIDIHHVKLFNLLLAKIESTFLIVIMHVQTMEPTITKAHFLRFY